jgi:hypothetical protein
MKKKQSFRTGRLKLPKEKKKILIGIYRMPIEIEARGGMSHVRTSMGEHFDRMKK